MRARLERAPDAADVVLPAELSVKLRSWHPRTRWTRSSTTVAAASGVTTRRASDALAAQKQNARAGWPQARDVFPAFSRGDRSLRVDGPSTVHVWCWLHARDYALLPFTAPRECDGAWAAAGFASGVPWLLPCLLMCQLRSPTGTAFFRDQAAAAETAWPARADPSPRSPRP